MLSNLNDTGTNIPRFFFTEMVFGIARSFIVVLFFNTCCMLMC